MARSKSSWKAWGDHPFIVGILVIAAIISIVVTLAGLFRREQRIEYLGSVADSKTRVPIESAKITLELPDAPPIITYTDGEGIYRFPLILGDENIVRRIRVDAVGYIPYDRNISLSSHDRQLEEIRLSSIIVSPTAIPTATSLLHPIAPPSLTAKAASSTPTATLQSSAIRTNPKDGAVYVWIPPGLFTMGSGDEDPRARDDEKPQHPVDIDGFWIMQTEVTNQQYQRCVEAGACAASTTKQWDEPAYANYPVTNVNWLQASDYAQWVGGRLPTEAEWEKACRGTNGRIYPWGNQALKDQLLQLLNYVENKKNRTMAVGSYPPGAHSLYDMAGNVWEWTSDWYDAQYYTHSPASNAKGPDSGTARIIHGGSFQSHNDDVRCAARGSPEPSYRSEYIGFRVVSLGF